MKKTVEEMHIHDRGYPGSVYQSLVRGKREAIICDVCEKEIRFDEKKIKGIGGEDICPDCVYSGKARKFFAELVEGYVLEAEMKFILNQL